MDKDRLRLVDSTFSHSKLGYCSDFQRSDKFVWDRQTPINECEYVVYTDMRLNEASAANKDKNIAWLIEPMCIAKHNYDLILNIKDRFSKILTHEKSLVDLGTPFEFIPFGCCWIPPEEQDLFIPNKLVSIIASSKRTTNGHRLRQDILTSPLRGKMDVYGRGWNPIDSKVDGLKRYGYSVVIENCRRHGWFTEKLLDCFALGTVPIYWGAPDIGDFFNTDGMIIFETQKELETILNELNWDTYWKMGDAIKDNYDTMKKYLLPDDWVYSKIKEND